MQALYKEVIIMANGRGGARPNAGRKAGAPNKKTQEMQEMVAATGITPLQYLLSVMRDTANEPKERLAAATAAAPYVHAKLSQVDMNANVTTHEASIDELE